MVRASCVGRKLGRGNEGLSPRTLVSPRTNSNMQPVPLQQPANATHSDTAPPQSVCYRSPATRSPGALSRPRRRAGRAAMAA
jgi:hypothetical protein